jgi:uncharacterized membrane protein YkvI
MLARIGSPAFHLAFQGMIFIALLETSLGVVNAIHERVAPVYRQMRGREYAKGARVALAIALIVFSVFIADRFGFVELIAKGYRGLAYVILAVFVLPLMTLGLWRLVRAGPVAAAIPQQET